MFSETSGRNFSPSSERPVYLLPELQRRFFIFLALKVVLALAACSPQPQQLEQQTISSEVNEIEGSRVSLNKDFTIPDDDVGAYHWGVDQQHYDNLQKLAQDNPNPAIGSFEEVWEYAETRGGAEAVQARINREIVERNEVLQALWESLEIYEVDGDFGTEYQFTMSVNSIQNFLDEPDSEGYGLQILLTDPATGNFRTYTIPSHILEGLLGRGTDPVVILELSEAGFNEGDSLSLWLGHLDPNTENRLTTPGLGDNKNSTVIGQGNVSL